MTMTLQGQKQTFKMDGKDYPGVSGSTTAWTQKGARQWEAVYKEGGKIANVDQLLLSADGKTLIIRTDRVVTKAKEEATLERVSGGPGLAGVWRAKSAAIQSTAEYAVSGDTLSVHIEPSGERWTGPLDGKDYPIAPVPTMARRSSSPR